MGSPTLTGFGQKVVVGMSRWSVTNNQNVTLATYSLGSCLGVSIYDPLVKVGGMLHLMLPTSTIDPDKAIQLPGMFVDTGIPALFRAAYELRAEKYRMRICVAGGAQIMDNTGFFNIGKRNYEALMQLLQKHGLKIDAEAVGGLVNRTMYLDLATGEVSLRISGQNNEVVLCKS